MSRRNLRIAYQELAEASETSKSTPNEFGELKSGTFAITVKDESDKVLYENKSEPFDYQFVDSFSSMLKHEGAKLTDDQIKFVGEALTSPDAETDKTIGEAIKNVVKMYNNKLKADAKANRYQSLVNKYKPLEGEKKETAIARTINQLIKLGGLSADSAISVLKAQNIVPEDYTVADYESTPLRRSKDED